jgi:hypothetical protein
MATTNRRRRTRDDVALAERAAVRDGATPPGESGWCRSVAADHRHHYGRIRADARRRRLGSRTPRRRWRRPAAPRRRWPVAGERGGALLRERRRFDRVVRAGVEVGAASSCTACLARVGVAGMSRRRDRPGAPRNVDGGRRRATAVDEVVGRRPRPGRRERPRARAGQGRQVRSAAGRRRWVGARAPGQGIRHSPSGLGRRSARGPRAPRAPGAGHAALAGDQLNYPWAMARDDGRAWCSPPVPRARPPDPPRGWSAAGRRRAAAASLDLDVGLDRRRRVGTASVTPLRRRRAAAPHFGEAPAAAAPTAASPHRHAPGVQARRPRDHVRPAAIAQDDELPARGDGRRCAPSR